MISLREVENAKKLIQQYEAEQLEIESIKNKSICSKCFEPLSERWEESACHIKLEIGIDCCATEALWGDDYQKIGFSHPAMQKESGFQKIFLHSERNGNFRLCWDCHRKFVRTVGNFFKTGANG